VNTLAHLTEKYPQHDFSLIMGEDNLKSFHKWKNYKYILEHHDIYIYPRVSEEAENMEFKDHPRLYIVAAPIVEISSTFIRESIKNKKDVRPLLPHNVWEYVVYNNFYKK
jgi:nicotinate-nucleotide adenylyltransferase